MPLVHGLIEVPTRQDFDAALAAIVELRNRIAQLENRMLLTEQQQADLLREVDETVAAMTALSDGYNGLKGALADVQAQLAALNVPAPAIDEAIAKLDAAQAAAAAVLAGSGGGEVPPESPPEAT